MMGSCARVGSPEVSNGQRCTWIGGVPAPRSGRGGTRRAPWMERPAATVRREQLDRGARLSSAWARGEERLRREPLASSPSRSTSRLFLQAPPRPGAQRRPVPPRRHGPLRRRAGARTPAGKIRRFKLFDLASTPGARRRAGGGPGGGPERHLPAPRQLRPRRAAVNKLILLHGPNGSAKSTLVDALKRGHGALLAARREGALYRFNWVFPARSWSRGSIGFGERGGARAATLATYAHLDGETLDARLAVPAHATTRCSSSRARSAGRCSSELPPSAGEAGDATSSSPTTCSRASSATSAGRSTTRCWAPTAATSSRCCATCRSSASTSRAATRWAAVTVEPQMSVDAAYQPGHRRPQPGQPARRRCRTSSLFEPHGPLVTANRGLIEYADLLKRPLEAFKYLLGTSETGEVPLEHFVLQLDEVLIASSNEKHLARLQGAARLRLASRGASSWSACRTCAGGRWSRRSTTRRSPPRTVGKHVAPARHRGRRACGRCSPG